MKTKIRKINEEQMHVLMLRQKVQLSMLPLNFLKVHWRTAFITAFRVDRNVSLEQYDKDLEYFLQNMDSYDGYHEEHIVFYTNMKDGRRYCKDFD